MRSTCPTTEANACRPAEQMLGAPGQSAFTRRMVCLGLLTWVGWLACANTLQGPAAAAIHNGGTSSSEGNIGATVTEQLKAFVEQLPSVAEMVAKICRLEGTNQTKRCYFVLLRRQANAFYYREAPELLDLTTTNLFPCYRLAGRYEQDLWNFSYDGLTLESSSDGEASLVKTLEYIGSRAGPLLNLGFNGALPGTIVWNGDSILPITNYHGVRMEGSLRTSASGLPQGLSVLTSFEGNAVPWQIDYEFAQNGPLPAYLPNKLTCWARSRESGSLLFEAEILSFKEAPQPLPKELFMPTTFALGAVYNVVATQNGKFFKTKFDTALTPMRPEKARFSLVSIIFISFVLISAAFVIASWRRVAANKNQASATRKTP